MVPRSYRGHTRFAEAQARFAANSQPVHVRLSGGGLVPQAAGVVNLHLAYPVCTHEPLAVAEHHYQLLCQLLGLALQSVGIRATAQAVNGSFCDGRFNLAVNGQKIAGTAQYWRRNPQHNATQPAYTVLSHAVLLVSADTTALTTAANAFEDALNSGRRYRADKITNAARLCGNPPQLCTTLIEALTDATTHYQPKFCHLA